MCYKEINIVLQLCCIAGC